MVNPSSAVPSPDAPSLAGTVKPGPAAKPRPKAETPPVIGIGASAGGLEALEQFSTHAPLACGLAFVAIQHLDPTQHGKLHLLEPSAPRGLRLPIDFFFRSLAGDRRERAIGVVITFIDITETKKLESRPMGDPL